MEGKSLFPSVSVAIVFALLLSACGGPPASPVDPYKVNISEEPAIPLAGEGLGVSQAMGGLYRVTGAAGSVPADATVTVVNFRSTVLVNATPNPDGSFVAVIPAQIGDKLEIRIIRNGVSSAPTNVYVGALNIKNPYTRGGNWYVGQVHLHTTNSDGRNTPTEMEAAYHDAGYDFVVSTDHRGTLPWIPFGGLTPDPDNSVSGKDLLWIRGSELGYGSVHMGAWGQAVQTPISFGDADGPIEIQSRIDNVRSNGGLIAINHPQNKDPPYAWYWYEELKKTKRYSFVEAFNGKHSVSDNGSFEISHLPTAVDLADEYYQVWWIGVDDCHDKDDPTQFDRYAIVVQTDNSRINQKDIFSSADLGNLYIRETGRGPAITSVTVEGNTITLVMTDVDSNYDVTWKKRGNEIVKIDADIDTTSSYNVTGNEGYVRAEITRKSDGKHAFTQPLFIANNVDLSTAVTVSSGLNAGNLIDNNRSTYWDAEAGTASFVVDVGKVRLVNAIKIDWFSSDYRRFNYKIETSNTGAFVGEQVEVVRKTYDNRSASTLDFFDADTRYIRVTITSQSVGSGNSVQVNEVQVFDSSPARTDLYLDNVAGNDANNGLYGNPWQTFNYARDKVRPRDTLHFVSTGVPYSGDMSLFVMHSGEHRYATARYQGDPITLTQVNANVGGIGFVGTHFIDWMYFDIHSASYANVIVSEDSSDINIMYNRLHDGLDRGLMGSGKFTLAYNLIYRNATEGAFIYRDNAQVKIYNNVFYGNGDAGLVFHNYYDQVPPVAEVMNNISTGNAGVALRRGTMGTITDGHNCVDGGYVGPWQRTANIDFDPLFVNPQAGDFRLQSASPCIDAGIDVGLSADFLGNPPRDAPQVPNSGDPGSGGRNYIDIGAYEY